MSLSGNYLRKYKLSPCCFSMDLIYTVYLEEWIMKEYILKNGKKLVIRLAEEKDAEGLLVHINQAGRETDFLGFGKEGYDKDIEDEKKYIKSFTPKNFMLVAVIDDEIIASCSIGAREERIRLKHMGNLGICVQKKAWGIGVGKYLMVPK